MNENKGDNNKKYKGIMTEKKNDSDMTSEQQSFHWRK